MSDSRLGQDPGLTAVLTLLTCGLYLLYWHYVTTLELKKRFGRKDIDPAADLLLAILTLGIWYFYTSHRNAKLVEQALASRRRSEDRPLLILILNLASVLNGVTAVIAVALLQDEYNQLEQMAPPPAAG